MCVCVRVCVCVCVCVCVRMLKLKQCKFVTLSYANMLTAFDTPRTRERVDYYHQKRATYSLIEAYKFPNGFYYKFFTERSIKRVSSQSSEL